MEYMTVSEVSKKFNVSTRMLRYYEKAGLLSSSRKENYAYRIYDEAAIKRLQQIIVLRKLRFPLKHIALILNDTEQQKALQIMRKNIEELDTEIIALNTIRDILHVFIARLDESIRRNIHLDLLDDSELLAIASSISPSKTTLKEVHSMKNLNEANEVIHKLSDREVRIIFLPPMTVAAVHCISESPENDCHAHMKELITGNNLRQLKPDFRVLGFNHDTPDCHGYEMWITIPENLPLPEPFVKKQFPGGLYGAHMIPMGAFEEWQWLYEWAETSKEYDIDWRAPEHMMGGMLEESLNYINLPEDMSERMKQIDMQQLDLLIPIRKVCE